MFSTGTALLIALVASLLLTGVMLLAHINKEWVIDSNFHIFFTYSINTAILFAVMSLWFSIVKSRLTTKWEYIAGIAGSLMITIVFSILSGWLHIAIYNNQRLSDSDSINLTRDIVVAIIAILIAMILYNLSRHHMLRIDKEKMETENLMVRYEALENQLDPHFLFNSLNTLSGLIGNDDNKAQNYLQQLASTYRYIMQNRRLVNLEQELQFVKSYCEMMQIRYGSNITFVRNIDRSLLHYQIIPISIQLLIENAIKHNVISSRHPLTITLETTSADTFRVSNAIQQKQEENTSVGLGLVNLTNRYQLLCKKDVSISIKDGFFIVEIPLLNPVEYSDLIDKIHSQK